MKIKKFFSGILAAIMSIAVIAAPVSAAGNDDEPTPEKGTIIINHAATSGTYTAYPIFVGNVEKSDDEETQGKLVIDSPMFHPNLETALDSSNAVIARNAGSSESDGWYGLYLHLNTSTRTLNGKTFQDLMKEYDPNVSINISYLGASGTSNKDTAEAIANLLNLTSTANSVSNILNGKGAAFYSAFAEAARGFMVDKIADTPGTLTDINSATPTDGKAIIEVDKAGYYLVEYTPNDYTVPPTDEEGNEIKGDPVINEKYTNSPRVVRRSLVLVGLGDDLSATINSKDTENVASIDIQFNETMLKEDNGNYVYNGEEGDWAKNVSAGNGDYVNCRVVVTLPSNLEAYDQYYLAVPIMYGYNQTGSAVFDGNVKSVKRVEGSDDDPLKYIKVYFLNDDDNKTQIIKNPGSSNLDSSNLTDLASEIFGDTYDHNAKLTIDKPYTYADDTGLTGTDRSDGFAAAETFVISDIANMYVRTKYTFPADDISHLLKSQYAQDSTSWRSLCIEFPVKFERFDSNGLNGSNSATGGVANLGYDASGLLGDDMLLKNYISAKLVYSNNPNLKALKEDETAYDSTTNPDGVKIYLDTSKNPGTLQNPVFVTKDHVSANIVTYRLRVHATTEDLVKICQAGGIANIGFAIKNSDGKYAVVERDSTGRQTYDEVDGEKLRDRPDGDSYPDNGGYTWVYKIIGWVDPSENDTVPDSSVLKTYQNAGNNDGVYRNNTSGRFEIVGIAPGDYTVVVLDEVIKTNDTYGPNPITNTAKEYKLPKNSDGTEKTDYRFSFNPVLNQDIGKQKYSIHYAPASVTEGNVVAEKMITNYNLKWYDGDTEITTQPEWFLGAEDKVALMSMRVTYYKKGLTLPVTGGIGTLIFFAVGGALVVISTVAIVTKFRIKREQL